MTTILELNDADLTLFRDGRAVHRAPGIAVVVDGRIDFGERALRLARVHPRQTNQHYFTRMSADPLAVPGPRARNHADLVYLHLCELATHIDDAVVLAVPAVFGTEQLGILLGILEEAGIRVSGFVDSAVAAASRIPVGPRAWHIDVLLQRAVVTALTADDEVARAGFEEVSECGLARLIDAWIDVVADRFIRETRFDPLHAAATEQQLYDQVCDVVWGGAAAGELVFELTQGAHTRRIELGRAALEEKGMQRFRQLTGPLPRHAPVILTPRAAALPGLLRTLEESGLQARVLPDDALPAGCAEHLERIAPTDGALRLVTRLPVRARPTPEHVPSGAAEDVRADPQWMRGGEPVRPALPTHALDGTRALPLEAGRGPFAVARHGAIVLLQAAEDLRLNGAPVTRDTVLEVGDRVDAAGREFVLIHVEP